MPRPRLLRRRLHPLLRMLLVAALAGALSHAARAQRPNLIVIHVDDLGWTDLSVQGSAYFETPHIDRLASEGLRFTNGYASAAICSPSRAALLTGRYPARIGITDWIRAAFQDGADPASSEAPTAYENTGRPLLTPPNPFRMEHEEVTLAEALRAAGYATGHIGKWHLGAGAWLPETQGFEVNIGGWDYGQPPSYFDPYCRQGQGCIPTLPPRRPGEYLTDREADEVVAFIRARRDRPFFLHYAPYAVHTPIQAKDSLTARYEGKPRTNQQNPQYAAMLHSLDEAVGALLDALAALGLDERTMIVFTGDNGGLLGPTDNAPLRSGKGFPYEGGLRTPFIVRWPGVVPAARVSYAPVMGIDVLPTLLEAAGAPLPQGRAIDGRSLLAHLCSGGAEPVGARDLFWHFPHYRQGRAAPPYSIVRSGDWKLVKWSEGPTFELYDLHQDPSETTNLAGAHPERVAALDAALEAWLDETGARRPRPNPDYVAP